ncbi:hypothetical protein M422DRAFT_60565 [Sphaerobolus stellatus SS14]|uniref:Large ribosomal subunit protein bL28m n=1 Tax=Sphaerobolus stellatus (strain SS14) TaxID=990650 RepID=A0A0C9VG30_SPHS4|nr:hypothetical protein M422DRAFT_60565 [Sphaerobolus stellatus SS14]
MFPSLPSFVSLPYSQPFKKAALGLFHGKTKRTGNNVPFSLHKTRRTWLPNSHNKTLYSEIMGRWIKTTVTARALRCVDKMGGLDNYLLNTRTDLLGYEGLKLRVMVREQRRKLLSHDQHASSPGC